MGRFFPRPVLLLSRPGVPSFRRGVVFSGAATGARVSSDEDAGSRLISFSRGFLNGRFRPPLVPIPRPDGPAFRGAFAASVLIDAASSDEDRYPEDDDGSLPSLSLSSDIVRGEMVCVCGRITSELGTYVVGARPDLGTFREKCAEMVVDYTRETKQYVYIASKV